MRIVKKIIQKTLYRKVCRFDKYFENFKTNPSEYINKILNSEEANNAIAKFIKENKPFMATRLGSGEIRCVSNYWYNNNHVFKCWHHQIKQEMFELGGLFPQIEKMLALFAKEYSSHFKNIDLLGVWFNRGEEIVANKYAPNTKLVSLADLEPYYHQNPWSQYLKGKKVLVVHPFSKTIEQQYKKRDLLFDDSKILPDFELITFKTVQSFPGHNLPYKDWLDALYDMKTGISKISFDIAVIGAGPYGLPLASYIKQMGKQAIHLGGATQILFGIKGNRWDSHPIISKFYNKYWVRPSEEEKPNSFKKVEDGAYW